MEKVTEALDEVRGEFREFEDRCPECGSLREFSHGDECSRHRTEVAWRGSGASGDQRAMLMLVAEVRMLRRALEPVGRKGWRLARPEMGTVLTTSPDNARVDGADATEDRCPRCSVPVNTVHAPSCPLIIHGGIWRGTVKVTRNAKD